ncbi:sugar transporter SWEET1 isoform X1 [Bemisia tabaci]
MENTIANMPLKDYEALVGSTAGIVTVASFFAPAFICKTVIKKGSTENVDPMPFIGGMSMSILMLQHGLILKDPAMIPVNVFGFILNLIYFSIYYHYSTERGQLWLTLGKAATFVAVLIGYAQWEYEHKVEFRFGLITTSIMFALISAPLLSLGEIIRTKNSASLPFPLIVSSLFVTSLWLLYGIIIENIFVQFQNAVAFLLCLGQLILCIIYPARDDSKDKAKKAE